MKLITFSGLDGCGKSTHAALTCKYLAGRGLRAVLLPTLFTSAAGVRTLLAARRSSHSRGDVSVTGHRIRGYAGGRTFDQDRRATAVRIKRAFTYPVDCMVLAAVLRGLRHRGAEAVVCDRYIYDKMVNLPRPLSAGSRLMRWIAPRPDLAVFLDAGYDTIRGRRVEHEPDYYMTKHQAYRQIADELDELTVISSASIAATQGEIERQIDAILSGRQ
jgi:thymidylate kinase